MNILALCLIITLKILRTCTHYSFPFEMWHDTFDLQVININPKGAHTKLIKNYSFYFYSSKTEIHSELSLDCDIHIASSNLSANLVLFFYMNSFNSCIVTTINLLFYVAAVLMLVIPVVMQIYMAMTNLFERKPSFPEIDFTNLPQTTCSSVYLIDKFSCASTLITHFFTFFRDSCRLGPRFMYLATPGWVWYCYFYTASCA